MPTAERSSTSTISSELASRVATDPDAPFLISADSTFSYQEIDDQAKALAAALSNLGVGSDDPIALVLPAWPEFAVSVFAAAKLGTSVIPLNPRLTFQELRYMLRHSGAACAVSAEDAYGIDYLNLFEDLLVELPEFRNLVTVGKEDLWYDDRIFQWEDLLSAGQGRSLPVVTPPPTPDDLFAIIYTPGTTGKPKGVELTHCNLLHAAGGSADATGLVPGDVVDGVTAPFHVSGLGPGLLGTMLGGAALVLHENIDAATALELADRHGTTVHYCAPALFPSELHEIECRGQRPAKIRLCVASGGTVGDDLVGRIEEGFGVPLLNAYSLTEASSTVAITRPDDPPEKRRFTVGRALADTSIRITDENGTVLPEESVGEICIQGPGVMRGYCRQPRLTAAALDEDGYFHTRDIGMLDEDGFLHLLGRSDEVVVRGGYPVHPAEVEDRLTAHPAVERAVVVGVQDEALGEAVCACVVCVEGGIVTEDELRDWAAVTLAEYKLPDLVRFMDDLPLTGSAQIWRLELARRVREEV